MSTSFTIEEVILYLRELAANPLKMAELTHEQYLALMKVTGQISRPERDEVMKRRKANGKVRRQRQVLKDRSARASTGIREAREAAVFEAPLQITGQSAGGPELSQSRRCYICKND